MSNGFSITGRKKNDVHDFYETPTWATEKALDAMLRDGYITKQDSILEPCSGAGAISSVLEKYGIQNTIKRLIQKEVVKEKRHWELSLHSEI